MGSIGVIFETFDAVGTLDKLGLRSEAIKSADLKDIGSPFKHMTDKEHVVLQGLVDQYFERFKSVVTTNRPVRDPAVLAKVTDGRVFSGSDAVALGLADQVGRLDDAVDLAKKMSNAPTASAVMYKRPYGYSGSIYADTSVPQPRANVLTLPFPTSTRCCPAGFITSGCPEAARRT